MNFLKRLFSPGEEPKQEEPEIVMLTGDGEFDLELVGESYYHKALEEICGPRTKNSVEQEHTAMLILEDNNPKDRNAVRVEIQGKQVGYLTRDDGAIFRKHLKKQRKAKAQGQCQALIKGGWEDQEKAVALMGFTWMLCLKINHRALILSSGSGHR